mmetsp:Transcript_13680/g.27997  ORF Transcript_13680/g.27997 Transcript_13680/m.27997 type:complete len:228 (+) Transcript_13680:726-1409(+)
MVRWIEVFGIEAVGFWRLEEADAVRVDVLFAVFNRHNEMDRIGVGKRQESSKNIFFAGCRAALHTSERNFDLVCNLGDLEVIPASSLSAALRRLPGVLIVLVGDLKELLGSLHVRANILWFDPHLDGHLPTRLDLSQNVAPGRRTAHPRSRVGFRLHALNPDRPCHTACYRSVALKGQRRSPCGRRPIGENARLCVALRLAELVQENLTRCSPNSTRGRSPKVGGEL